MTEPEAVQAGPERRIALVDLLDRVLAGGVVVSGEITLAIADVDLVHLSLRALLTSASTLERGVADA
ncbi:gas vesicle protein [Qaidamihabitans albus]|uniref:gas vesicle protein n=1 Tax=Qaidamihabitans albus TaxID=2795733 RepID=UPI0018F1E6F6|nr:gas vesicle protein [Qaidamihabitans albus]